MSLSQSENPDLFRPKGPNRLYSNSVTMAQFFSEKEQLLTKVHNDKCQGRSGQIEVNSNLRVRRKDNAEGV